ncbi:MAG: UDP-glucose/GDP-mannose dehydrogenase family protein [Candidatus Cohnella colombiensis]|uniref:UDP-glucose 6-dehydrogenase n=1 Tax=Candidatus Cohnella colombiensis TaxID=3121368 RepID=A0AA95EWV8_9BACL|nr:MAG: UDP-glucose/GDP-mannose dehydrogenase family protein [Cohnella sp.]
MKVTVIGTGYVGLATGISLAYLGHQVSCVDIAWDKIMGLREGKLPIYEPGLDDLFMQARANLLFTTSYIEAIEQSEVVFITVGTPANVDGSPNLTYLFAAVDEVLTCIRAVNQPIILVNKSTVPVGTADLIAERVAESGLSDYITIASNPEFLSQGNVVSDTLYPERIVIGGNDHAWRVLSQLYEAIELQRFDAPDRTPRTHEKQVIPILCVDTRSAELAKYAANAFLAMKISFINEIANVCDRVGADVSLVASVIGKDPRIGASFLRAGIGYGGSCFPKDTKALQYIADTSGYEFKLLSAVIEVNNEQKYRVIEILRQQFDSLYGRKVAILGLTFKPGTDDLREAPSIPIVHSLLSSGCEVYVHDPIALDKARELLPATVNFMAHWSDALRDADAAILLTEWPEYVTIRADDILALMNYPLFIDGRNVMDSKEWNGIQYRGVGLRQSEHKRINSNILQSK